MSEVVANTLDHILRAHPPWQRDKLTECGRLVVDVKSIVSRDEIVAKVKRQGKQRAAFSTCMTCATRYFPGETWEQAPAAVLSRYVERSRYSFSRDEDGRGGRIQAELRALALLYRNHQEEFEQALIDLGEVSQMDAARAKRRERNA